MAEKSPPKLLMELTGPQEDSKGHLTDMLGWQALQDALKGP